MPRRLVSTGGFVAADRTGKRFQLEIFTEFEDIISAGYFRSEAGKTSIRTVGGEHVEPIEKGRYRTVETGIILTSDDPLAP